MSDENDINAVLNKLDNISIGFIKIVESFKLELLKIKKILNYSKEEMFIPRKFFNNFLRPQLEKKKILTKKEMFSICDQERKYNSYYTLSSYLHILESKEYITSKRIKNVKHYMLISNESQKL